MDFSDGDGHRLISDRSIEPVGIAPIYAKVREEVEINTDFLVTLHISG